MFWRVSGSEIQCMTANVGDAVGPALAKRAPSGEALEKHHAAVAQPGDHLAVEQTWRGSLVSIAGPTLPSVVVRTMSAGISLQGQDRCSPKIIDHINNPVWQLCSRNSTPKVATIDGVNLFVVDLAHIILGRLGDIAPERRQRALHGCAAGIGPIVRPLAFMF